MGLRTEFEHLRNAPAGTRFTEGFERTHVRNYAVRMFLIAFGVVLMLVATVTFWVPGPNFVLVFLGLMLVGGQSRTVAGFMDRGELRARRWHREVWEPAPAHLKLVVKVVGASMGAIFAATMLWFSIWQGLVPGWVPEPWYEWVPTP